MVGLVSRRLLIIDSAFVNTSLDRGCLLAGCPKNTAWINFIKLARVRALPNIAAISHIIQRLLPLSAVFIIPW
ncbi:hypothetical protein ES708_04318 [subsurface metagenome]